MGPKQRAIAGLGRGENFEMRKTMMSGVQLTHHGGPEALVWNDSIAIRELCAGEVLVKVLAAGVNNTDINTRIGWYSDTVTGSTDETDTSQDIEAGGWGGALEFPRIQGGDLCGVIAVLGPGAERIKQGQRVTCPINWPRPTHANPVAFIVLGSEVDGSFAQYCIVDERDLFDVSSSPLSDVEIAAIPCAYGTAENALSRVGLSQGQKILITGASGGVGLAAVQLAGLRDTEITGVAAPLKADAVRDAGAAQVLSRDELLPKGEFDVVFDVVGGANWPSLLAALKPGGHYGVSGAIAGPIVEADLRNIYLNDLTLHGCTYQPRDVFERIAAWINSGEIRPLVSKTYPLRNIAEAQADFASKRYPGKLVLIPEHVA